MGTSVDMLGQVYGLLLPDAADHERAMLDAFDGTFGRLADIGD
jgi:hypothetical protein